jgi:hypothetical protein
MTVPSPGFPNLTDYREAIQNPSTAFADPELQRCQPELTPLGLPLALSGGFAGIFHLKGSREWAVRCFIRSVSDLTERYRWISDFLTAHQRPFFPPVRVPGTRYLRAGHVVSHRQNGVGTRGHARTRGRTESG